MKASVNPVDQHVSEEEKGQDTSSELKPAICGNLLCRHRVCCNLSPLVGTVKPWGCSSMALTDRMCNLSSLIL